MDPIFKLDNAIRSLRPNPENSDEAARKLADARTAIVQSSLTGQVHDLEGFMFPAHQESLASLGSQTQVLPSIQEILTQFVDEETISVQRTVTRNWGFPISVDPLVSAELGAGQAPVSSLGPFLDPTDAQVGVSVFASVAFTKLQRVGNATPFFYFPGPSVWPAERFTTLSLGAGTIWIPGQQFISNAPSSGFIGLKIESANLNFSTAVTRASLLAIPFNIRIVVNLTLASVPTEESPWSEGLKTPTNAQFVFNANSTGVQLASASSASVTILGNMVNLRRTTPATSPANLSNYDDIFGRIRLPFLSESERIPINTGGSKGKVVSLTSEEQTAGIINASWSLPVNITSPDALGEASGSGGISFTLGGVLATVSGLDDEQFELNDCIFIADPSASNLGGKAGHSTTNKESIIQVYGESSVVKLRSLPAFTFRATALATGQESWAAASNIKFSLDSPRTVNNERLLLDVPQGTFALIRQPVPQGQPDSDITNIIVGGLVNSDKQQYSFALNNLFLRTDAPQNVLLNGVYAKGSGGSPGVSSGSTTISLPLKYVMPFLPDPYTTNLPTPSPPERGSGGSLGIKLTWDKQDVSQPVIDISLPTTEGTSLGLTPPQQATFTSVSLINRIAQAALLDLSTNASQFGVILLPSTDGSNAAAPSVPTVSRDLFVQFPGKSMAVLSLPAVQWEPVYNKQNPNANPFPRQISYPNSGSITALASMTANLIPLTPRKLLDGVFAAYNRPAADASEAVAIFTLPFGIQATVRLVKSHVTLVPSPVMTEIRPTFEYSSISDKPPIDSSISTVRQTIKGSDQFSLRAPRRRILIPIGGGSETSPSFTGSAQILSNAISIDNDPNVKSLSAWGKETQDVFNPDFTASVPITRVDITGFGESIYSDWRKTLPGSSTPYVSKVLLEAMVGRAQKGEIQTYRECFPFAFGLIRTINIDRGNLGTFTRTDSGWQPVSNGRYRFKNSAIITHPGIIVGVQDVTNVRDGPPEYNVTLSNGILMAAVIFDCNVNIQGLTSGGTFNGVPARDLIGYVQITLPKIEIQPADYADLLNKAQGRICGLINCAVDVANTGMEMHLRKISVKASTNTTSGAEEFVVGAYGSLDLRGGGGQQWSFVQMPAGVSSSAAAVDGEGVPLIRLGPVSSGPVQSPPAPPPYRFTDPGALYNESTASLYYGLLHATGSQRILFSRPKIESDGNHQFTSKDPPLIADMFALATTTGPFPFPSVCIPFNDASFKLVILPGGHLILRQGKMIIPASLPPRKMINSTTMVTQVANSIPNPSNSNSPIPSEVTIIIDTTSQTLPWSIQITNISVINGSSEHPELLRLTGSIEGSSRLPPRFEKAGMSFGEPLKPATDVIAFLSKFGPLPPWDIAMRNELSFAAKLTVDIKKYLDHLIPPLKSVIEKFLEDLNLDFKTSSKLVEGDIELGGRVTLKIETPSGVVVICLAGVDFRLSSSKGERWEFKVGGGVGYGFSLPGGFKVLGWMALAAEFIKADNGWGVGASLIVRGGIDLKVITAEVETEAKFVYRKVTCNESDSTVWGYAQLSIGIDISIFWVIEIEFEVTVEWKKMIEAGPCPFSE